MLVDLATSKTEQQTLPPTQAQVGVVCSVIGQYWTPTKEVKFAQNDDWFRHRVMETLWGHASTKVLNMASISTMIDELGRKEGERWFLSERGRTLLSLIETELEGRYPTQQPLL